MKTKSKETGKVEGEGSYTATRAYSAGVARSVKAGHSRELGEKASKALDGPEGNLLRCSGADCESRPAPRVHAKGEPSRTVVGAWYATCTTYIETRGRDRAKRRDFIAQIEG